MSVFDDLKRWQTKVAAFPPLPHVIMASPLVPSGRVYRQYNTRGELILWANRGEIDDLPRVLAKDYGPGIALLSHATAPSVSIPVVWA